MKKIRLLLMFTLCATIVSVIASLFISSTTTADNAAAFHSLFGISVAVAVLHTGAAVGFLFGLKNFKASLKIAYGLMCIGFIFLGLTFFQTPLLSLYDLWDSPWVEYGGVILPLLIAAICLYLGARSFARLLGVKQIATSFGMATLAAATVVMIGLLIPHPYTGVEEQQARASAAFSGILTAYLAFATWSVFLALQKVGPHLKEATKWLCIVLLVGTIAGLQHTILGLFLSHEHWYQAYGLSIIIHVIDGAFVLWAAYLFNKSSEDDTLTVAPGIQAGESGDSAIDIVVYTASLASTPADIDTILDGLRLVTAGLQEQTELDATAQQRLGTVYAKLEHYLATDERLRNFTEESIRQKVHGRFKHSASNDVFWQAAGL